ncbi:kinesin-like protein KIN-10B [Hibiscus syriacus]|uniref:kinesin-like protein KIN-10B n=1 Tax=Hibiscus syriacus TaxID=106335 RepID=UPI0019222E8E|nr:kinesin-like protein KIN-10B [Hibiscus syriacus]
MEAKLKAWLESKGKKKSALRMVPSSIHYMKKLDCNSSCKAKISNAKARDISLTTRNLFSNGGVDVEEIMLESTMNLAEESSCKEETTAVETSVDTIELSPVSERKTAMQSPQRKALCPISSNIIPESIKEQSSKDQISLSHEPKSPQSPSIIFAANKFQTVGGTPLDKRSAWSSKLKSTLIQEYVEFLNTASREELLGLKGIGTKMTEYIIELRETSPLESLSDLEKIGLSSKQVYNLFSRAAKGIIK